MAIFRQDHSKFRSPRVASDHFSADKHHGRVSDRVGSHRVIECQICQFRHILPLPTDEELKKFYAQQYYNNEKTNYFADAEEDLEWWMLTYNNQYQLLERQTRGRKLLDIGSGPGYFLKCGQERGWDTVGLEPSNAAFAYSRKLGVTVINDFFPSQQIERLGQFDVVCLASVLEHSPNPRKLLAEIKRVLKINGLIFVLSPNDYNPLQAVLRSRLNYPPWWVVPAHHYNYFDFSSIKRLLAASGYEILETNATYPMEFFLLSGRKYIGNRRVGRKCHRERKEFESQLFRSDPELLNSLYNNLAKLGIGREFVVVARNGQTRNR